MAEEKGSEVKKDRLVADVLGVDVAITPSDLCNQQFRRSIFGGYQPDEVDVFLERVANAFELLLSQMKSLKEKNEEQRALLEEYREMEGALRNAIVSSQQFGQDIIENAKREAHALVQEGRLKKAQTELDAAKIPVKLSQDIRLLQEHRSRLRRDILAVLETHRRLLENLIPEEDAPVARIDKTKEEVAPVSSQNEAQPSPLPENTRHPAVPQPEPEPFQESHKQAAVLLEVARSDSEEDVPSEDLGTPEVVPGEETPEIRTENTIPEEESLHVDA